MVSPLGSAKSILYIIDDIFAKSSDIQIKMDILEAKMARVGGMPKRIEKTIIQHQMEGDGFKTIIYRHCFPISMFLLTIRICKSNLCATCLPTSRRSSKKLKPLV